MIKDILKFNDKGLIEWIAFKHPKVYKEWVELNVVLNEPNKNKGLKFYERVFNKELR